MKFAIVSWYGSGTNLLRCFLNSHPDVFIDKELFAFKAGFNGKLAMIGQRTRMLENYFNDYRPTMGVDLKYDHVTQEVLNYLVTNNVKVLHLIRDPFRTVWYRRENVPADVLKGHLEEIKNQRKRLSNIIDLEITYEEMTQGREISQLPEEFTKKLFNFLEIQPCELLLKPEYSVKPLILR